MIAPYNNLLFEFAHRLELLGFTLKSDSSYMAVLSRADGYQIEIIAERRSVGFSVCLCSPNSKTDDGYPAVFLMQAIDPLRAERAVAILKSGEHDKDSISHWWNEFTEFLLENEYKIFQHPFSRELRTKVDEIFQNKLKEDGIEQ